MPTRCEPCSLASSFWWSICFSFALRKRGGRVEKKNSRGSKVSPRGPSLLNVPCCTAANGIKTRMGVIGFNKLSNDHFKNGWLWLNEIELFLVNSILLEGFYKNVHLSQKGESVPGRDVKVSQGYLKDEFLAGLRTSQPFGKGKQKLEFLSL